MFPHIPLHTIAVDLTNTQSISHTVDNILNGSISTPPVATPLSTASSAQVPVAAGAAPTLDTPTSALIKATEQEHNTSESAHPDKKLEPTQPEEVSESSLAAMKSNTDSVSQEVAGMGCDNSASGLRQRRSANTASQLVGELSSNQDGRDTKIGYACPKLETTSEHDDGSCPVNTSSTEPRPVRGDIKRCPTDHCAADSQEQQQTPREDTYLSLQQRKNNMLQAAKHRYLKNHPEASRPLSL